MDEKPKYIDGKTKYSGVRIRGESIQIDFRYKGIRCRETLKMEPNATNLRMAANLLGKINIDIAMNNFNYADYFPNSSKVLKFGSKASSNKTVSEAFDWWWPDNCPPDKETAKKHKTDIDKHIKPGIGEILLSDLQASQVKRWIKSIELSASAKNNILTPLRKLFIEAYSEGLVKENIMTRVQSFKRGKPQKNPLTISNVTILLKYLKITEIHAYYKFAIWTGVSTGEQLGLKWRDINFDKNTANINCILTIGIEKSTKNSYRDRNIELLSPAYHALLEILPDDFHTNPNKYENEYIFKDPFTGYVWTSDKISGHWKTALKDLKIKHRRAYETRHTFASILVTACVPDGWIRMQMGHATMEMLSRVYAKWLGDGKEAIDWVLEHTHDGNNGAQFNKLFLDVHEPNLAKSHKINKNKNESDNK